MLKPLDEWQEQSKAVREKYAGLEARILGDEDELIANEERLQATEEARAVAMAVASMVQQSATAQVASVVTKCLQAVFEDPYEFEIVFEQKRGKTEARLVFVRDGQTLDPLGASGGGVVDVAAFALRLASLALSRPACRRLVVMDEPFRFVSKQYRPRLRDMLTALADEMGFQFVFVTHIPELAVGHVVTVGG